MTDLPAIPAEAAPRNRKRPAPPARTPRQGTGKTPWPVMLLAGSPKTGTARIAAVASGSELVGRTFWVSWRERTPDALAAVEGARFEIVEHSGTLDDFDAAVEYAIGQPVKAKRPNLLVIDGVSQLWESIKDWGTANAVGSSSGAYWYAVNDRWSSFIDTLRKHAGPVILVGRLDGDVLLGHKDLAADVDVLVEIVAADLSTFADLGTAREQAFVSATRTEPPLSEVTAEFSVEGVWRSLSIGEARA